MICPEDIMIDSYSFSPTRRILHGPITYAQQHLELAFQILTVKITFFLLHCSPNQSPSLSRSEFSVLIRPIFLKRVHLPSQLTTMSKGKTNREIFYGFYMGPIKFSSCQVYDNHFRFSLFPITIKNRFYQKRFCFIKCLRINIRG